MLKIILFFALLLATTFGFSLIADTPGKMTLSYHNTEIEVSLLTAFAGLIALFILLLLLWTLIRSIFRLPSIMRFSSQLRRKKRGYSAVSRGLVALGSGDTRAASRHADEAAKFLGKTEPLALMLQAQTAQASGNAEAAEKGFRAMLEQPDTRALGFRGLYTEAQRHNDGEAARSFAEEAYRADQNTVWASDALLSFRAHEADWGAALGLIDQAQSRKLIDKDTAKRRKAVLLTADAISKLSSNPEAALKSAKEALSYAPSLVPAATLAAKRYTATGDYGKSSKVLETAWKLNPHPDLADAYLNLRPGDAAQDRLKRGQALLKLQPNAREARFALARAALDARDFKLARHELETLSLEQPTVLACRMMAELEEAESHNLGAVRAWLARAAEAPRDPAWVADGDVSEYWLPLSPITGEIDAYKWMVPPQVLSNKFITADEIEKIRQIEPKNDDAFLIEAQHDQAARQAAPSDPAASESDATTTWAAPQKIGGSKNFASAYFSDDGAFHAPDDPGAGTAKANNTAKKSFFSFLKG